MQPRFPSDHPYEQLVRAHRAAQRPRVVSNLNAGWERIQSVDFLIDHCLREPEGGIIGSKAGDALRVMVYG